LVLLAFLIISLIILMIVVCSKLFKSFQKNSYEVKEEVN